MLEELRDQDRQQTPAVKGSAPESKRADWDRVLAALRGNHLAGSGRHRQGVVFPRAIFLEEACEMASEIRHGVTSGDPLAALGCFGSVVGLTPTVAPDAVIGAPDPKVGPAFCVDLDAGCAWYELDRVLERAQGCTGPSCVPASRLVRVRLPDFLMAELRRRQARVPRARQLCDLVGRPDWEGRARATPGPGYRLKPTLARFRRSLGPLLLDDGVPPMVASAALLDFRLGTKSNHSYVVYPQSMVDDALDRLYRSLGWD